MGQLVSLWSTGMVSWVLTMGQLVHWPDQLVHWPSQLAEGQLV